ncbi:MAG: alpha/beta fold hydrolase [Acidimicrobiia bacterium]|nr:alpha/beta fold hydrolase [Acidimicrobiia bacterium]
MRVTLVHGFTQTARSWDPVSALLRDRFEVVTPEVPGGLDFAAAAAALGETGGAGTYVGYSMGGRLCLRLALDRPDLVTTLVLVGASPGIADPAQRAARREADERLAAEIERDGVDAFLERWLAQPLFATLPRDAAGLDDRRTHTAGALAETLRRLGTGVMEPLWPRLGELAMPVLLVAGELDPKFAGLAAEMAAAIGPHARVALVPGAGHAVPLEAPDRLAALLTEHLGGLDA